MNTKRCSHCKQDKAVDCYSKNKKSTDGLQSNCKLCATQVAKDWYRCNVEKPEVHNRLKSYYKDRQREFKSVVDHLKDQLGCLKCDEVASCCLDFHHAHGQKEQDISWLMKTKNRSALESELLKCVCICANCHRKLHAGLIAVSSDELTAALARTRALVANIGEKS